MSENSRPRLLASGLDSLYVAYFIEIPFGTLDWDELGFQKEKVKQKRKETFSEIQLGCERFALKPYGRKPYTFILSNRDYEIALSENMQPRCTVQFSSEALWKYGLDTLIDRLTRWFDSMGFVHTRPDVVFRADWAFDYDMPLVDFTPDHFVTRAVKEGAWRARRELQSVQFGKGAVVVRAYDKIAEIAEQSGKAWFYPIWGQSENVWRVEFQVRSERLQAGAIHSTDDLRLHQNDLLRELLSHTTLRVPSSDSNRSRWPWHPLWNALRDDIATLPQTGIVRAIDPQMPLSWRLFRQCKALHGSLKGIAAVVGLMEGKNGPPPLPYILERLPDLLTMHHDNDNWIEDVARRMTAHSLGQW